MTAMPQVKRRGLDPDDMLRLSEQVLSYAKADYTRVNIQSGVRGFTRTAINRVTTAGNISNVSVRITSVFGKRTASMETNRLDDRGLQETVRNCESIARLSPEDPEYLPELESQKYVDVNGYYASTGDLSMEDRARSAGAVLKHMRSPKMVAAGFIDVRAGSQSCCTSRGLFAYESSTAVAATLTIRTHDGLSSGWAGDEGSDWSAIDSERIALDAIRKCGEWEGKTPLEPGRYDVILEPTAFGVLMLKMMNVFDARMAEEGRSYFSKQGGGTLLGEKVFDERVTITSNPAAANAETSPFASDGQPVRSEVWVDKGVLRNLSFSRFWAQRKNVEARPSPLNLIVSGGSASLEDMIKSTKRGVLITRFWYIRPLNPRQISQTGLTRDGTFFIENGKISRPVVNFRFNQSIGELLKNVEMLGRSVRVCATETSSVGAPIVVPAVKVRDFNLASVSDAV